MSDLVAMLYTPTARAPQSGGGTYRRPRDVWVLYVDPARGPVKCVRSPCIIRKELYADAADSRYTGPRSAYGRALRQAEAAIAAHNAGVDHV